MTLQTFRNTHAKGVTGWRTDWRRERRYSGGGIAMDHGSHTFYLAFEWLGAYPTGDHRADGDAGAFDTEDDFTCSLRLPDRHSPRRTCRGTRASARCCTRIHGEHGAIRVEDDDIELAMQGARQRGATAPHGLDVRAAGDLVATGWTPAT